jgi:hypothetical protein
MLGYGFVRELLDHLTGLQHVAEVPFASATLEHALDRKYPKQQPVGCQIAPRLM